MNRENNNYLFYSQRPKLTISRIFQLCFKFIGRFGKRSTSSVNFCGRGPVSKKLIDNLPDREMAIGSRPVREMVSSSRPLREIHWVE